MTSTNNMLQALIFLARFVCREGVWRYSCPGGGINKVEFSGEWWLKEYPHTQDAMLHARQLKTLTDHAHRWQHFTQQTLSHLYLSNTFTDLTPFTHSMLCFIPIYDQCVQGHIPGSHSIWKPLQFPPHKIWGYMLFGGATIRYLGGGGWSIWVSKIIFFTS